MSDDPVATTYPWQPGRSLDPELAEAIKEAKLKTRASWRKIARHTGLSHSFLVQLSNGQRVPSIRTVEILADALPIEEWAVERLREVAVRGHGRDRPG
jgi:cyanate lyase